MADYPPDIDQWRRAGRVASEARELGAREAKVGVTLRELAERIEALILDRGAQPAFPANLSRNVEAAHFTPPPGASEALVAGDLLKIDVGAHLQGAIADTARTIEVGGGRQYANLIAASHEALDAGIAQVHAGVSVDRIGAAIEQAATARGFKPIEDLSGHSVERYLLHAGTSIPNVAGLSDVRLREGQVVAIEPFVTNGAGHIVNGDFGNIVRFRGEPQGANGEIQEAFRRFKTLPFTARWLPPNEAKGFIQRGRRFLQTYPVFLESGEGLVAQAEHTILVTADGAEVLSR
ncbi:MAG: type II methionyl aminopeptidase [Thermoplasmata archaeon]